MTIFGILEIIVAAILLTIEILYLLFLIVVATCLGFYIFEDWRDKRKEKKNGN